MKRWHAAVLALTFSGSLAWADDAVQILRTTEETYRNLKHYDFEGTTLSETKMGASMSKSATSFVVAFKEPNVFRLEYDYPAAGKWERVSDGKTLWNHRTITKESKETPITEDDVRMLDDSPIAGFSYMGEGVASAQLVGSEPISVGGQSSDCYVVQFEQPNPKTDGGAKTLPVKLWIDKNTHLVLREVSGSEAKGKGSSTENKRTVSFTRVDVSKVPDDLFQFKK